MSEERIKPEKPEELSPDEIQKLTQEEQQKRLDWVNEEKFGETKILKNEISINIPAMVFQRLPDIIMRTGGMRQVKVEVRQEFSFDDKPGDAVFTILHTSAIDLGVNKMIRCLDDESIPTALDWKEQMGKKVLWGFTAREIPMEPPQLSYQFGRTVYHKHWRYITIPET